MSNSVVTGPTHGRCHVLLGQLIAFVSMERRERERERDKETVNQSDRQDSDGCRYTTYTYNRTRGSISVRLFQWG